VAVQTTGFGFAFQACMYSSIAATESSNTYKGATTYPFSRQLFNPALYQIQLRE